MPSPDLKVLVIGANRGIGLQFVKSYLALGCDVTGTMRPGTESDPSIADLKATGAKILEIDYTIEDSIKKAAHEFGEGPLDVLVNNGGVHVYPESWLEHTRESLLERFTIMAVGPFLASKHFLPNLKRSRAGKILNVSSDMGSIGGECIAYRLAKSALNQQTVTIGLELKNKGYNISTLAVNPGWIKTRMTTGGNVDIVVSVEGMIKLVDEMTVKTTGQFREYNGKHLAW